MAQSTFATDAEIFDFVKRNLYVAVVCDILDSLDFRSQAMHQRIRPLLADRTNCGFVGRARTFQWMYVDYIEDDPYQLEIDGMDALGPGDVAVHSEDPLGSNVPWGELLTTVAKRNGAVGCVCDSNVRDCVRIIELGFPVFHTGIRPLDSRGRATVKALDVPIRCGGVLVHPGDLVFADFDGVVVVPRQVEERVLGLAREKVGRENVVRKELREGKTLRDVYDRFRVL